MIMAYPSRIMDIGNGMLKILFDDGTTQLARQALGGMWYTEYRGLGGPIGGGGGNPGNGSNVNPYGPGVPARDDWESHASYSAGGWDFSGGALSYGNPIPSPAAGNLRTSGGSGEFAAGDIGSAGLRSILELTSPVARVLPKSGTLMNGSTREADGPMVAIVFQHQSRFADPGPKAQLETVGYVGDSGNNVTHLHIHGLDADGNRVDWMKFVTG
jgi:hypothetical protein